ncbi:MAG: mechanosensitive ion channel [Chryseolinea sp.]
MLIQGGICRVVLFVLAFAMPFVVYSQRAPSGEAEDTSYVSRTLRDADLQSKKTVGKFTRDRLQLRQQRQFERIHHALEDAKSFLREGVDTASIRVTLQQFEAWDSLLEADAPGSPPGSESFRNLVTLSRVWNGLKERVAFTSEHVRRLSDQVDGMKYHLDSLSSDSVILTFPEGDSAAIAVHAQRLELLTAAVYPVDSTLSHLSLRMQELLNRSNLLQAAVSSHLIRIQNKEEVLSARTWTKEVAFLWDTSGQADSSHDTLAYSAARASLALRFYLRNHAGALVILFTAVVIASVFLRALRKILEEEHLLHEPSTGQLVLRYPILSGVILSFSILQFIFPDPPMVFTLIVNTISAVALTAIFRHLIHAKWMRNWILFLLLFLATSAVNLTLVGSVAERWIMLLLALLGIAVALNSIFSDRTHLTEKRLIYFVIMVMIMEFLSIGANVFGRYNLAKNLLTTGYLSLIVAVIFLWTVRFINEGLALSFHVYTLKDRQLFSINFEKVGTRAPLWLYMLLVMGWLIMVFRNFYVYRLISEPLGDFILEPRMIGDYTFSIASILTFVLIMFAAAVVSRVVSFFASDRPQSKSDGGGLGSLLLLVRIGIFSIGLFLAFAAAGIPVDKMTIILGALSVGIGFGLQTLVNNLVSGLIIAFERPVNVGDIVEIDGQEGVMKAIGFRSSRISTWEGADVIMPNGDLLSGKLVNWTGGDTRRRMDLSLSVAYGSDLTKVEHVIKEVLKNEGGVIAYPEPVVQFQNFGENGIYVIILFWVSHFRERGGTKSKVIVAIDAAFRSNGITMPFPQRLIHIKKDDAGDTDRGTAV